MRAWILLLATGLIGQVPAGPLVNRRAEALDLFRARPEGVYAHYCAHCHGEKRDGMSTRWPGELETRPADLSSPRLDAAALAAVIRSGTVARGVSTPCPAWEGTLDPPTIARLVRHLEGAAAPAAVPAGARASAAEPGFPWELAALALGELVLVVLLVLRHRRRDGPGNESHGEEEGGHPAPVPDRR